VHPVLALLDSTFRGAPPPASASSSRKAASSAAASLPRRASAGPSEPRGRPAGAARRAVPLRRARLPPRPARYRSSVVPPRVGLCVRWSGTDRDLIRPQQAPAATGCVTGAGEREGDHLQWRRGGLHYWLPRLPQGRERAAHGPLRFRQGNCAGKALQAPRIGAGRAGPREPPRAAGASARPWRSPLGSQPCGDGKWGRAHGRHPPSSRSAVASVRDACPAGPRPRGVPRDGDDHRGRRRSDERSAISSWLSRSLWLWTRRRPPRQGDSLPRTPPPRLKGAVASAPRRRRRARLAAAAFQARLVRRPPRTTKNRRDVSLEGRLGLLQACRRISRLAPRDCRQRVREERMMHRPPQALSLYGKSPNTATSGALSRASQP
jgi:hypothetical protein